MLSETLIVALQWIMERVRRRRLTMPENTLFFADIKEDWRLWWRYASASEKAEIVACGQSIEKQHAFFAELERWARERWPAHPQASVALMFQLLSVEPFSTWTGLRKEILDHKFFPAYGVAIPGKETGGREHIWRLTVWLAPKLDGEPKNVLAIPLNFETHDAAAKITPSDAIKAIQSTLRRLAGSCFLKWYLQDGWKQSRWEQRLFLIAPSVSLALLVLLTILPAQLLNDDQIVALALQALTAAAATPIAAFGASIFRRYKSVVKDSEAWLQTLEQSRVLIATSASHQPRIKGASFGLTLGVSLLLALDESVPAKSAFVRHTISELRERCEESVFTGCLSADGTLVPVDYLVEKFRAAVDFNEAADRPLKVFLQPNEDAKERLKPKTEAASAPHLTLNYVHAASKTSVPEVRSYSRLADILFEGGSYAQYALGSSLLITALCFGALAFWTGLFELSRIIHPPEVPKAAITLSPVGEEWRASLTIYSPASDQFVARVRSEYWQSCTLRRFPKAGDLDHSATVVFSLTKSASARPGTSAGQGTVELIRLRSVLWRSLPPAEKLSIATFDDLINSGPPF